MCGREVEEGLRGMYGRNVSDERGYAIVNIM